MQHILLESCADGSVINILRQGNLVQHPVNVKDEDIPIRTEVDITGNGGGKIDGDIEFIVLFLYVKCA